MRWTVEPFKIMFIVLVVAVAGLVAILGLFITAHPEFGFFQQQPLAEGWTDPNTYVSSNFTLTNGSIVKDIFGYSGASGKSIIILGVQPLTIDEKGPISINFNGIELGETSIVNTQVVNTSIASCCFVTFVQAGVDNVVKITSNGFEGNFRYLIIIPVV